MYSLKSVPNVDPAVISYAKKLVQQRSITPDDNGCQTWLASKLSELGFKCHHLPCHGVSNLVAEIGTGTTTIGFCGHTDVVCAGDETQWYSPPFAAEQQKDFIVGRGISDMKGGIAAMLAATENVLTSPLTDTRFMWLITSDEEGEAEYGSKHIAQWLAANNYQLDMCIVGEPTAKHHTGDGIKIGRRGALSGKIVIQGKQGHVAYPQHAVNAIHEMHKVTNNLLSIDWEAGSDDFPSTSLQITYIDSGTFTDNIIPASCAICFNVRFDHHFSIESLKAFIEQRLDQNEYISDIVWERPCEPYFCAESGKGALIDAVDKAVLKHTGKFPLVTTSGGTSDGRFFASPHTQIVELGLPNNTIHQVNERAHVSDIVSLVDIYTSILEDLLLP